MPTLNFSVKYKVNEFKVWTPAEIKQLYLYGINLQKDGKELPDEVIENYINSSVEMIENYLQIKLKKQVITENKDFIGSDWEAWGIIRLSYPVVCPLGLIGFLGTTKQVTYPSTWLSSKKNSDGKSYSRIINLVPNTNSQSSEMIVFSGIMPNLRSYGDYKSIPNYWQAKYITGFDKVPEDLRNVIGKYTALNVLALAGDFLQRTPGQSSGSISLDGLSQSTSTFASSTGSIFGARIKQYSDELKDELKRLSDYYTGLPMTTA